MEEVVLLSKEEKVATITINRPKKMNALNYEVQEKVLSILDDLEKDNNTKVVIVTGAGEKSFVAGADIKEFLERAPLQQRKVMTPPRIFDCFAEFPKPVIAMINGYCLGGGMELAMSCDIRVASHNAVFGQPEIKLGLIPGGGGTQRLPRLCGIGQAMRLILTGDTITAEEAYRIGLIEFLFPHDKLLEETKKIANKISSYSLVALKAAKEALIESYNLPLDKGLQLERDIFTLLFTTQDMREGVSAFLEKRKPRWSDN